MILKAAARLVVVSLFASLTLSAQTAEPLHLKAPTIPFEKYKLANGLEVILSQDKSLPVVTVNLWYHVGAANESAKQVGFAHLFEHMMFEGSGHVGARQHFKYLEAAGVSDVNGTTSFDRTNYFETIPSNQLALGLWLESDRMGFFLDTLDRERLTSQRDVVRNERRQTHENVPYGVANEAMYHALFPSDHPYYGNVMGSHAQIESARLVDIRSFFKTFYAPNNATLTIVGNFETAEAKAMIEKYFGPIHRGPVKPALQVVTPPITAEKRVTVTDQVQLPMVSLAWLAPKVMQPGDAELDIASTVLGGGRSSRLYQELVYKQQIAQQISCSHPSQALASIFECDFIARPGVKPEQLEAAAEKVIDEFRQSGPTEDELNRARTETVAGLIRPLEQFGSVADTLQSYNQTEGDPGYLPKDIARYEALMAAGVKKWADETLAKSKRVVVDCVPGERKTEDVPRSPENTDADFKIVPEYSAAFMKTQAFRDHAPAAGPTPKLNLPVPVTFTLANGLQVMVTEKHKLPLVSAAVVLRAGSERDTPVKPGVSGFTAAMLTQGTTTRSPLAISNTSGGLGMQISAGAGDDSASVSMSALTPTVPQAMDLFTDVTLHPAFAPQEIERVRARRITALLQNRDEPSSIAQTVGMRALYGANSSYGYNASGTEASLKAITRDDLTGFYKTNYGPNNAVLVFAGDVTLDQAKVLATKYFGGWTGDAVQQAPPPVPDVATHKIVIVDKPGAPQTQLTAFGLGLPRFMPDHSATVVMNAMLGGLFSSRLNMNLREAHGYTYGASTGFSFRRDEGTFLASAAVRTDATALALKEMLGELDRIHSTPLSGEELKMAKDYAIHSLPGEFDTSSALAAAMAQIWVYNLPLDYYHTVPARLEAVTSEQAEAAATAHIHADKLVVVAVGDKAQIEPGLKALNFAPIEEWTEDGEPKKK